MGQINNLAKKVHQNSRDKGFYGGEKNIGEMLALIHSEVSEALEADRNNRYMFPKTLVTNTFPDNREEWRSISGHEGEYEVSNLGRVKSLDMKIWGGKVFYPKEGKILSPGLGGTGYLTVSLRGKTHKVARLVGLAFVGGYEDGLVINHINGIKTDDYSNNLEWVTSRQNNNHALKSGLRDMKKVLSKWDMYEIAARYKYRKQSIHVIQEDYRVSLSRIKSICYNPSKYLDVFEFELADIMIRVMDLAEYKGIDLEKHIELKMRYNSQREYKHGNKKY